MKWDADNKNQATILVSPEKKESQSDVVIKISKPIKSRLALLPWDDEEINIKDTNFEIKNLLLEKIVESSKEAIIYTNKNGKIAIFNKKAEKIFGYRKTEVILKRLSDFYLNGKREAIKIMKMLKGNGKIENYETKFLVKNGRIKCVSLSAFLLKNGNSEFIGTLFRVRETKEEKEKTALNNEETYKYLFEESHTINIIVGMDGKIIDINGKILEIFGYRKEDVIGKNVLEFVVPEQREKAKNSLYLDFQGIKTPSVEFDVITPKGIHTLLFTEGHAKVYEKGETIGVLISAIDITEKKKAEKKINFEREKLNGIMSTIEDGIDIVSYDYVIKYQNKMLRDRFGDLIGKLCYKEYMGKEKPCSFCPMRKAIENSRTVKGEFKAKDGRDYELISTPLKNPDGSVDALEIVRDITEQKKAERELRESEQKYSTLVEKGNDGIIIVQDGVLKFANSKIIEIANCSKKEVIGKKFIDFVSPKYRKIVMERYKKRLLGKKVPNRYEIEIISKDGKKIPVEINASRIEFEGKPADMAIIRDIRERKKAEEELIRLSNAVKMSTDSIVISNLEGNITYINEATLKMYGTEDEHELIGKSSFELIAPEDQERAFLGIEEVLEKGYVKDLEYNILTKEGNRIPVEMSVSIMKDKDGKPVGFVSITREITERINREQEIINLKEYNEKILQSVKSGIVVTDSKLNVLTWNNYMEESCGIKKEKILGKNLLEKLPKLKCKEFEKKLNRVLKKGETFKEYMVEIRTKKGTRYYNLTFSPRKDNNKIIGILMSFEDVTELAEIGKKLTTIYELTNKMIFANSENEVLEIGLDAIENVLKFNNCSILFEDKEKNELYVKGFRGYSKNIDKLRVSLNQDKGIVNLAYKKEKLINVKDVRKSEKYIPVHPKIKSEIAVPLKIRDKTIGVINVESDKLNAFSKEEEKLLTTLATEISTALANIQLYKETERRANALASLNKIGRAISSTLELEKIYKILYKQMSNVIDTKNLYIVLYNKRKKELNFELEVEENKLLQKRKRKCEKGLTEYVIKTKKPLLIKNNYRKLCKKLGIIPHGRDAKSWLGVPLISKGKAIGVITIQDYEIENAYDEEHVEVISTIADQLSIAIENSKLYKRLEEKHKKLKKAFKELKKLEEMKSEFLTVTSHEFGTPITILKGNISMFLDGTFGKLTKLQRKRIESLKSSIDRLAKMRRQTILLSKLDSGKLRLKKEKIAINELIENIANEISILAKKNNQKIKTNLKECKIYCDKDTMQEVFENLLSNAVKYSGEGSKIEVNLKEGKENVLITVSDNGNGIPKDKLEKIFERFYIAHDYLHHKEGTGLGLAIVKEIVEAHCGKVWCESKLNKGARFNIILPKKK